MTKWEYAYILCAPALLMQNLANMGKDGWELIKMETGHHIPHLQLVFKRPIEEGPTH